MNKTMKWITLGAASAITCVAFVACAPASLEKAQEKMEAAGYTVETEEYLGIGQIYAYNEDGDVLSGALYESTSDAKSAYELAESMASAMPEGYSLKRIGKWVVTGTDAAIKAFK